MRIVHADMADAVPRIPLASLSPAEFRERFMVPNLPVMLTGASDGWRAVAEWIDASGEPDVARLAALFPGSEVAVVDGAGKPHDMSLREYADWWVHRRASGPPLYLKDWHQPREQPDYGAYRQPQHVADDWLNEHWAAAGGGGGGGDHRFVYVGPAGSKTALHADVFFSFSWSANVCGRKRWWLLPAAQRRLASDAATQPLAADIRTLRDAAAHVIELEQGPGELLFVPSGWYHQVENMRDTISINHNWLNACNARWGLRRLRETLDAVRAGLGADAADQELCMGLLRRRCGLDLWEWAELLAGVCARRLPSLLAEAPSDEAPSDEAPPASLVPPAPCVEPARAGHDVQVASALLRETLALLSGEAPAAEAAAEAASETSAADDAAFEEWDELEEERQQQLLELSRRLHQAERALERASSMAETGCGDGKGRAALRRKRVRDEVAPSPDS